MRVTTSADPIWKAGGVAGTDIASLMNCPVEQDKLVYVLWAQKLQMRELAELRKVELEQGGTTWLDWRRKGVGGSEVAGLVGAGFRDNKSGSGAIKVWEEKTNPPKAGFENENMRRGKEKEKFARERYENLMGWSVPPACVLHDTLDFIRVSLDGIRADDKLISEIKCSNLPNHTKYLRISRIDDPLERQYEFAKAFNYYRYQVLYQLLVTDSDVCHFVGYCEDVNLDESDQLAVIELYPEPKEQQKVLDRVTEFWSLVEKREVPSRTWLEPCYEMPSELGGALLAA